MPDLILYPTQSPLRIPQGGGGGGGVGFNPVFVAADYNANYGDLVIGDPSSASFVVTLPTAASATGVNNAVVVKNESSSENTVTVTPQGGDTIDERGPVVLGPDEVLYVVSDGIGNFVVISSSPPTAVGYFNVRDYGALGRDNLITTGDIVAGSNLLTVADATGFKKGCYVTVDGAGPDATQEGAGIVKGVLYDAKVVAINGNVLTLSVNAVRSVIGGTVRNDDLPAFNEALAAMNWPLVPPPAYIGPYSVGQRLIVPPGERATQAETAGGYKWGFRGYRMSRQFNVNHRVVIDGAAQASCILKFDDAQNGVVLWSNNNSYQGGDAEQSRVRNLTILGAELTSNPPSIAGGLYYKQRAGGTAYVYGNVVSANTYSKNLSGRAFACVSAGVTAAGDDTQPDFDTQTTTTGQINPGSNQLTVADPTGFTIGDWILVEGGAGGGGYALPAQILNIAGDVFTLSESSAIGIGPGFGFGADGHVGKGWQDGTVWWVDIDCHGVLNYTKSVVEHCYIDGFAGNGYACIASVPTAGNANNAQAYHCVASLCGGNGFYCHGNDANMVEFLGCDGFQNGGWGIVDDSFLGSRWTACETDDNLRGSHWMTHGSVWGGYAEGGQGPIFLGASAGWIDGFSTDGFTDDTLWPTWQAGHAYAPGDTVLPTTPNGYAFRCFNVGGVSGGVEPAWKPARGFVTDDNGITWYAWSYTDRSLGFRRNLAIASPMIFVVPNTDHEMNFKAARNDRTDTFFSWHSSLDADAFAMCEDYHGVGWNALTFGFVGPPTKGQAFALATDRAVTAGTAEFAGQLMIPDPHIVGSVENASGRVYVWASDAPPTTGHWLKGSVLWNTAYNGGNAPGWRCSATGTPGTWVEMSAAGLFDNVAFNAASPAAITPGDFTVGQFFMVLSDTAVEGVSFFWNDAAPVTIDCTLYDSAGAVLATKSINISAAGSYTVSFNVPMPMSAYTTAWATFRQSSGTSLHQGRVADFAPGGNTAIPYTNGNAVFSRVAYGAGAGAPTTDSPNVRYPVMPVFGG